jgi:hypothetical protein
MWFKKHEIEGSEMPIIFKKADNQLTYDEIVNLQENPAKYEHVGFMPIYPTAAEQLFEKVYEKGE